MKCTDFWCACFPFVPCLSCRAQGSSYDAITDRYATIYFKSCPKIESCFFCTNSPSVWQTKTAEVQYKSWREAREMAQWSIPSTHVMAHNHLRPQFQRGYTPSFDLQEYGMHVAHKHVGKTLIHKIKNKQIFKNSGLSVGKKYNRSSWQKSTSWSRGTLHGSSFTLVINRASFYRQRWHTGPCPLV